jgi:hypothetical protein
MRRATALGACSLRNAKHARALTALDEPIAKGGIPMRSTTTFLISPLLTLSALAQVPGEPRKTEPQAEAGTPTAAPEVREREDDEDDEDKEDKEQKEEKEDDDDDRDDD